MKVLLVNQIQEGSNKYTFSLARGLQKLDIDISVCGIETDDVSAYRDVPYFPLFGNYSVKKGSVRKVVSYNKSWEKIYRYCLTEHVNIVHVQWYIFSPLDWTYQQKLRKKGIKVVTTIHDLLPFNKQFYDFYFLRKIYCQSNMVINQAKKNESELVQRFGVSKENIVYIPHGHYMEYAELVSKTDSVDYLGLPKDRPIILFFGLIRKSKGLDILIKSMKTVIEECPNAYCVIAGKVWKDNFSKYQELINDLELGDCIRADIKFIPDNEIKYYFNASDVVALPYREIYQSGVVLLATAYQKPVVATTEGEFLNVIKNKETGLLVESGNVQQFAEALLYYLKHPTAAKTMAKACKEDLSVRLNWDNIARQVKTVYETVYKIDSVAEKSPDTNTN